MKNNNFNWTDAKQPPEKNGAYLTYDDFYGYNVANYYSKTGWIYLIANPLNRKPDSIMYYMEIPRISKSK